MNIRSILNLAHKSLVMSRKEIFIPFSYELSISPDKFDEKFNVYRNNEPLENTFRLSGWTKKGHLRIYVNHMRLDEDNVLRSEFEYIFKGTHAQFQDKHVITGHIFMDDENRLAIFYAYFALIGFLFLLGVCLMEKKRESFIALLTLSLFFLVPAVISYFYKIYTIRNYSQRAYILITNYLKGIENYTVKD